MSARQVALGWLLACVSCAPAGASTGSRGAVLVEPSHDEPSPSATSSASSPRLARERALQEKLSATLAYVSEIRSLPAKTGVKGRLISRDEIERFLNSELEQQTPKDAIEATQAILFGFGTVDAGFDYRQNILKLMTSQLLGFYDPKQKTFFLEGSLTGEEADVTLVHELVHALQDQHYDLSHFGDFEEDAGDRLAAVHGLAEGDATSAMLDAMLRSRGSSALDVPDSMFQAQAMLGSAAASAPPVLVRSLVAPYIDGLAFTNALRRQGGFGAVDDAWRALPASTEQLLHVEKFRSHEAPLVVALPPPPPHAPELALRFHDVMGEQTLRIFLEEWLPARTAAVAASDWGGDRLSAFADDARQRWAIGWHLRFDSPAAAERAFLALARSAPLTERDASSSLDSAETAKRYRDKLCRPRHARGPLALVRRGADVAVTLGPFTPTGGPVAADPDCRAALGWATAIVTH